MINTKYQAVECFTFLQKICSRNGCEECEEKSCGVLFVGQHAYSATANIVGRIGVNDNLPMDNPIFWSYGREGEINRPSQDKFLLNTKGYIKNNPSMGAFLSSGFIDRFDHYLNKAPANDFRIRRKDLLDHLDSQGLSSAKQNKMKIQIGSALTDVTFNAEPIKWTKAMDSPFSFELPRFVYPGTYQKSNIDKNVVCSINLLSFYEIIANGFTEYEIIRIKYDNAGPVVIEGKARNKSEVFFAVSQI